MHKIISDVNLSSLKHMTVGG